MLWVMQTEQETGPSVMMQPQVHDQHSSMSRGQLAYFRGHTTTALGAQQSVTENMKTSSTQRDAYLAPESRERRKALSDGDGKPTGEKNPEMKALP